MKVQKVTNTPKIWVSHVKELMKEQVQHESKVSQNTER